MRQRTRLLFVTLSIASTSVGLVDCAAGAPCPAPASPAGGLAAPPHRESPGPIHHVVLVTLDGMLPDSYEHPDAHGLRVPTLRRIVAQGAASDGALSVFPPVTYPSHTSISTGVFPGEHGITSNRTFDPLEHDLEGWRWYAEDIQRDPIWRIVERAGYRAALVNWPVSVGAQVTWLVPEYWRAKDDNDRKLSRALSTPGLLEAVAAEHPDFWSRFAPPDVKDDALTDIAIHVLETGRPNLLQLHLFGIDGAQHHHGLWSPEALAAIEKDDSQLGRLLAALDRTGLAKDTSLILASDHGFMNADRMVRPGTLLRDAGLVTTNAEGRVTDWKATLVTNSGQAYVYLRDPSDAATRDEVRRVFASRVGQDGSGIGRLYEAADIRAEGGDPDAFLALEATPGWLMGPGYSGDYSAPSPYRATHGYDPSRPEMRASLLLLGPNVPHGTLSGARLVDVAPTIAEWLGLAMSGVDGRALRVTPAR